MISYSRVGPTRKDSVFVDFKGVFFATLFVSDAQPDVPGQRVAKHRPPECADVLRAGVGRRALPQSQLGSRLHAGT